jgi:hypothetical protein
MKKILFLLSFTILFQSRYSYQTLDIKNIENKDVKLEFKNSRKYKKKL